MSHKQYSLTSFSNAIALGTLIFLLGIIFLTITNSSTPQQSKTNAAMTQDNTAPTSTVLRKEPTKPLISAPRKTQLITPTIYCIHDGQGDRPCTPRQR